MEVKQAYNSFSELEKLIGKSCDLIDASSGKPGIHDVFICGVTLTSGFTNRRFLNKPELREAYIYYKKKIPLKHLTRNIGTISSDTWPVKHIGNIKNRKPFNHKFLHYFDFVKELKGKQ